MNYKEIINSNLEIFKSWRKYLHKYPETAYNEINTSNFISDKLKSFGIEIKRSFAKTGVVGKLILGNGGEFAIGLRADMDALFLTEDNHFEHRSYNHGKMHGCGHDGHITMLLGAAFILSQIKDLNATVYFIFQPAEENELGGKMMVKEGLFKEFPMKRVYGLHNWPTLEFGKIAIKNGPIMASSDSFDIKISGKGAHGAMPHLGADPIIASANIITALQSIVSRNIDPLESAVVSITKINSGDTYNIIPKEANLSGTVRTFDTKIKDLIKDRVTKIASNISSSFNCEAKINFKDGYLPTINNDITIALQAGIDSVGAENIIKNFNPSMGAEDFGFMLNEVKGAYVWIGSDEGKSYSLHSPKYDFNDNILEIGITYWIMLVKKHFS